MLTETKPVNKNETYVCIRECYTYNKRFKVGDVFPYEWLSADYYPNHHFLPQEEARAYLRENGREKRPVMCAGDDPRSNIELMAILNENGITNINPRWTRKDLFAKVQEVELQLAKAGATKGKGK